MHISSVLSGAFLAGCPSASQHLLLVARAVAFMARGVTFEPREVFRDTMRVGSNNTSGKGSGIRIGGTRCGWGSHIGAAGGDWGDLNILSCGSSGCGSHRHLLAEFLRLLDGWRVVSSLWVLSPSSCQSLPLKRIWLRLNLLYIACVRCQGTLDEVELVVVVAPVIGLVC
jgi:hypothetical protein